jgi:homoaconitase/3-isopropylmalate dehydratase large subunit
MRALAVGENLTRRIIRAHLAGGRISPGEGIALRIDQMLIQDAIGTMVWQGFGSFGVPCLRPRACAIYVDHNIPQTGCVSQEQTSQGYAAAAKAIEALGARIAADGATGEKSGDSASRVHE